jgi:hypothetical protein
MGQLIEKDLDTGTWRASCAGAPPPLHVTPDHYQAQWVPLARPQLRPTPPGPEMVYIDRVAPFGDDPTDPTQQTVPRYATAGMIGRLNPQGPPS